MFMVEVMSPGVTAGIQRPLAYNAERAPDDRFAICQPPGAEAHFGPLCLVHIPSGVIVKTKLRTTGTAERFCRDLVSRLSEEQIMTSDIEAFQKTVAPHIRSAGREFFGELWGMN